MNLTDWIGSAGVGLLLAAFVLNLYKKISQTSILYCCLNFTGAALACLASVFLAYWPFILLEGVWLLFSLISLAAILRKKAVSR
jgi:hypothetical protein